MNTRIPDADGTHRLGGTGEPLMDALTSPRTSRPRSTPLAARQHMLDQLRIVENAVEAMLDVWQRDDHAPDLLDASEYPFTRSLEDQFSAIQSAVTILDNNLTDESEGFPPAHFVAQAGLEGIARGQDRVTWEDIARHLLDPSTFAVGFTATGQIRATAPELVATATRTRDTTPQPLGWCERCGHPFEPRDDLPDGVGPTCEHAGDPPVHRGGTAWEHYLEKVRAIRHVPGQHPDAQRAGFDFDGKRI